MDRGLLLLPLLLQPAPLGNQLGLTKLPNLKLDFITRQENSKGIYTGKNVNLEPSDLRREAGNLILAQVKLWLCQGVCCIGVKWQYNHWCFPTKQKYCLLLCLLLTAMQRIQFLYGAGNKRKLVANSRSFQYATSGPPPPNGAIIPGSWIGNVIIII